MEFFRQDTSFDFMGKRKLALIVSTVILVIGLLSLLVRGLNWGLDFTGGTLVEASYSQSVDVSNVRDTLGDAGVDDAIVQYFGTDQDIAIRLPATDGGEGVNVSSTVMKALRSGFDETLLPETQTRQQQCTKKGETTAVDCHVQMRRVEFVGPAVGDELANDGGIAVLIALACILVYVAFRFEWKFSIGSVAALVHDVLITLGIFSLFQIEFSLPVLAAVLAVIGYSLNDTIVVFDRIRENFRKMRRGDSVDVMNLSINQTLRRTLLTSVTTLLVVLTLLLLGGDVIRGFSIALLIGVVVGTYSSIFVASPVVLALGISRDDLMSVPKEGAELDPLP